MYELHKNEFLKTWHKVVIQPLNSKFKIDFNHMSDWTDSDYDKILGVLNEEERYGPLETPLLPLAKPSILNKIKLHVENHNLTAIDWR